VILFGVTSIAMLTSVVTSYFVSTKQMARSPEGRQTAGATQPDISSTAVLEILARLRSIENALDELRESGRRS